MSGIYKGPNGELLHGDGKPVGSPHYRNLVDIAREIATLAHRGQYRRDGRTAYIHHPQAVAELLEGLGDEIIATAWLHDVLEDTNQTLDTLREAGIPTSVLVAVIILTKGNEPYRDYLLRIKGNSIAVKVKVADMLSNLADKPTERQIVKYAHGLLVLLDADIIIL